MTYRVAAHSRATLQTAPFFAPDSELSMRPGGFYEHLSDAIAINRARSSYYAARTNGHSRRLSAFLIWFERACLPIAMHLDRRARKFNERSVPILEDDFASMEDIAPEDTPPQYTRRAPREELKRMREVIKEHGKLLRQAVRADDFRKAARGVLCALDTLERFEESTQTHYAMTKHLFESIGLASANSVTYARMTNGETIPLSRHFIRVQALAFPTALRCDRLAQSNHELGVGILVNDVPHIPFRKVWESGASVRSAARTCLPRIAFDTENSAWKAAPPLLRSLASTW